MVSFFHNELITMWKPTTYYRVAPNQAVITPVVGSGSFPPSDTFLACNGST